MRAVISIFSKRGLASRWASPRFSDSRHSGMVRKDQTRNLEVPGSLISLAPRNDERRERASHEQTFRRYPQQIEIGLYGNGSDRALQARFSYSDDSRCSSLKH